MASLQLDNVTKVYPDGHEAVHGLDLAVDDGEFCVIVGPSGCGKSTVLRMVAGLEGATDGDILIDGERINETSPQERNIAMTFQENTLYPNMTVEENLGFSLTMSGTHRRDVADRVAEVARLLHVTDLLDRMPSKLSGGQRQRVALGRSIIRKPRLFLMDEPLSNLDSQLRLESRAEILRIQRSLGTTTMFVTHDQVEAMAMADRITVMRDGHVVQTGTPSEIYAHPVDMFVAQFMGMPPMSVVVATVVEPGPGRFALRLGSQQLDVDGASERRRAALVAARGRRLGVGFRPEFLRRDDAGQLVASVEFTESLGAEQLVHASIDAPRAEQTITGVEVGTASRSMITAFVDSGDAVSLWAPFTLRVDTTSMHLFDLSTGRTLPA